MILRMGIQCFLGLIVIAGSLTAVSKEENDRSSGPKYGYVYNNPDILTFDIAMSEAAFEKIKPERKGMMFGGGNPDKMSSRSMFGMKFNYAEATVTCNDEVYTGVGIRHRGNASMVMIPSGGKKPYKLDFDRFKEGQTFHGFKKLNFINCMNTILKLSNNMT